MIFKFDPNSTKNEGRWRLRDKSDFVSGGYITKKFDNGINYILGRLKNPGKGENGEDFYVQAIRFKKSIWDEKEAAKWWNKHGKKFERPWTNEDWAREKLSKIPREEALKIAKSLARKLKIKYQNPDKVTIDTPFIKNIIMPAGSIRRGKKLVGDIDLVVTKQIDRDDIKDIKGIDILLGAKITTKFIYKGVRIDMFVFLNPKSWGACLMHYTGPFDYNQRIRGMVKKPKWTDKMGEGWKLSQNGLYKKDKILTFKTERELQNFLGIKERKPSER